jgi:hypothetical protein
MGRTVESADGTGIAFERAGAGPVLIMVDGAGGHRALGTLSALADLLADDPTVVQYDRRGRGDSAATGQWSIAREVDGAPRWNASWGRSACRARRWSRWARPCPRSRPPRTP